jgi:hypothetical protein
MNLFEKEFKDSYLKYHTNPIPPNALDPRVFYSEMEGGDPKMLPEVKLQILNDIDAINSAENESVKTRVNDYIVVGPILKKDSSKFCPITIIVKINTANLDDILKERILQTINSLNDRRAPGTTHPLHYIPTIRDFDLNSYESAYHPFYEKWLKKPKVLGEAKHTLDKLKDPVKTKIGTYRKTSLKKGIKKLTTI